MEKLTEEQLKSKLRNVSIKPDSSWQESTLNRLLDLGVPKSQTERNNKSSIFYLLFSKNMSSASKLFVGVLVAVFSLVAITGTAVYASDDAVPGDLLYPVDKAWENVQRAMIQSDEELTNFEMDVLDERVKELKRVQERKENQERINEAVKELEDQQKRVNERVRTMEELHVNGYVDDQEQERVQNRYENQYEEHKEYYEELENKYQYEYEYQHQNQNEGADSDFEYQYQNQNQNESGQGSDSSNKSDVQGIEKHKRDYEDGDPGECGEDCPKEREGTGY